MTLFKAKGSLGRGDSVRILDREETIRADVEMGDARLKHPEGLLITRSKLNHQTSNQSTPLV
jgi:hypothetical protein